MPIVLKDPIKIDIIIRRQLKVRMLAGSIRSYTLLPPPPPQQFIIVTGSDISNGYKQNRDCEPFLSYLLAHEVFLY